MTELACDELRSLANSCSACCSAKFGWSCPAFSGSNCRNVLIPLFRPGHKSQISWSSFATDETTPVSDWTGLCGSSASVQTCKDRAYATHQQLESTHQLLDLRSAFPKKSSIMTLVRSEADHEPCAWVWQPSSPAAPMLAVISHRIRNWRERARVPRVSIADSNGG